MKQQNSTSHKTTNSDTCLERVVGEFLNSTHPPLGTEARATLRRVLTEISISSGDLPIGSLSAAHLLDAIAEPAGTPRAEWMRLQAIKRFFGWCRCNGYIPFGSRPSEDQMDHLSVSPPRVLTSTELKQLFQKADDVELRLYLALRALAGLRRDEAVQLSSKSIISGKILLVRGKNSCRQVEMCPALHAWLQPAYGTEGRFVSGRCATRLQRVMRKLEPRISPHVLRSTFGAVLYAITGDWVKTAASMGIDVSHLPKIILPCIAKEEAEQFLGMSPEVCGIVDWSQQVELFLRSAKSGFSSNPNPV